MKIVKILGGLGNQMFQYALYLALKKHFHDEKIMIDTSCFIGYPLHNGFELDKIFSLNRGLRSFAFFILFISTMSSPIPFIIFASPFI